MRPHDPRLPGNYFFASVDLFTGIINGPHPAKLDKDGNVTIDWLPGNITERALVETVWDRLAQEPNSAVAMAQIRYLDHMMTCPGCTFCGYDREPEKIVGHASWERAKTFTKSEMDTYNAIMSVVPAAEPVITYHGAVTGRMSTKLDDNGVDRADSPEGYEARKSQDACRGCSFLNQRSGDVWLCGNVDARCLADDRADTKDVIFVKKV